MTLSITEGVRRAVIAHAEAQAPIEACGVIVADETGRPVRLLAFANVEESTTAYRFDPEDQLATWREIEDRGHRLLAIYHSHTASEAYPSSTDVAHAAEPGASYLIVSTSHAQLRSYRIADGRVTEEEIEVRQWPE